MLMRRLREQDGFTLPELLVAISIALIVSLAAFSLIEFVMKQTGEVNGRVEATQRGRIAMDTITRQLRSQVCLPSGTPSMYSRAGNVTDDNNATFFVDFRDGSDPTIAPDLHTLSFVEDEDKVGQIVESDYAGKQNLNPAVDLPYNAPPVTKVLLNGVVRVDDATPIFRYFKYDGTAIATPVSAADLKKLATIKIAFRVLPAGTRPSDRGNVVFQDQIFVRDVDPNVAIPNPTCA
jgi:prepilin-type N-terminal cleavage/methylation domain-containing protein